MLRDELDPLTFINTLDRGDPSLVVEGVDFKLCARGCVSPGGQLLTERLKTSTRTDPLSELDINRVQA
ncbi:MAG: hypothetical protein IKY66_05295 [Bacteroidales bacterium]|nr:hypothetical protein [Bacteroidales bacterium]